jgi:hypothetical protein
LSTFVSRVVFTLHSSFAIPLRGIINSPWSQNYLSLFRPAKFYKKLKFYIWRGYWTTFSSDWIRLGGIRGRDSDILPRSRWAADRSHTPN